MRTARRIRRRPACRERSGFSMIEAIIGIAVIGIAMLGLAQIFLLGVANNRRGGEIASASFYAQQRIDYLRALTADELNSFPSAARGESADETLDINSDGTPELRRLTQVTAGNLSYTVKVLVFPAARIGTAAAALIADPSGNKARAVINTVISR
jgi:prepilin-type N-terminal cleavage/methylation domain-containing protein